MTARPDGAAPPAGRSRPTRIAVATLLAAVELLLIGLGVWQLHRRAWKHELIARVEARVHAAPTAPPGPAEWSRFDPAAAEYRHVTVRGRFLERPDTLVQALTERGGGFWVMTPLAIDGGGTVLVNRGFVPADQADQSSLDRPAGETAVTGLLRLSEPGGSLLRRNDPAHGRWFSRDVGGIAAARGLSGMAPYFIDADATPNPGGLPVGGLTVIAFPDNHLVYALTWFALAALLAGWLAWAWRDGSQKAHRQTR